MSEDNSEGIPSSFKPVVTTDVNRSRATWAPEVHRYFGESCFFVIVRINSSWSQAAADFRMCFEQSGVKGYSIYPLFGHYDALLRVWANPYRKERFLEIFGALPIIEYAADFEVESINYTWAPTSDEKTVAPSVADVETVTRTFDAGGPFESRFENSYNRLVSNGLLYELKKGNPDSIKFYLVARNAKETSNVDKGLLNKFIEQFRVQSESLGLQYLSIYSGRGFAMALMKGVVEKYSELAPIVELLSSNILHILGLKVTTLLIAESAVYESEQIIIEHGGASAAINELRRMLPNPIVVERLVQMSPIERAGIEDFYTSHAHFIQTTYRETFLSIIEFKITQNKHLLIKSLSFLVEFEYLLRDYFIHVFAEVFGQKDWIVRISEFISKTPELETSSLSPGKLSLGEMARIVYLLEKQDSTIKGRVSEVLGSNWFGLLADLTDIRNDFAHGRMYAESYKFPGGIDKVLERLIGVGEVYIKLKEIK